jgi:itaconate CoA-transferase
VRNREAVDAAVAEAMSELDVDEAIRALDDARIASARLNAVSGVLDHPQLTARDRWRETSTPVGVVRALRSAVEPVGEAPIGPVPALGEQTDAVLGQLGYDAREVAALRAAGVVA